MTKDEFKALLDGVTTIDEIINLRKQVSSTHFMSECTKKLTAEAEKQGYLFFDTSYNVAENLIGGGYVSARKQNFICKGSKKLNELNGKQIADAYVYYSDGKGRVGIIVKLETQTGL